MLCCDKCNSSTPGPLLCAACRAQRTARSVAWKRARRAVTPIGNCNQCLIRQAERGHTTCATCTTRRQRSLTDPKVLEQRKQAVRRFNRRIREETLTHYGHACACCGEAHYEFLALDHINGDGKHQDRRKSLALWAYRNGFPDTLRILCHNCNCALGFYGFCPHQTK